VCTVGGGGREREGGRGREGEGLAIASRESSPYCVGIADWT
jgi:hypothetical protein